MADPLERSTDSSSRARSQSHLEHAIDTDESELVVRVIYVVPKADEFPKCWPILRQYFGEIRPAAMMISAGLSDPRMASEIQVTAHRGGGQ